MSLFNSQVGAEKIKEIIKRQGARLHFLGIGGAGMLPLAELLSRKGVIVSGTDRALGEKEGFFASLGISTNTQLHDLGEIDTVVYTLAIDDDDPELTYARSKHIPLVSRAELLGAVMLSYNKRIGVSGTHGKSTTVAMIHKIFDGAGMSPTAVSGAELSTKNALALGDDEQFIFEACEYKDSFLSMFPTTSVITGVELDHTDYFKDEGHIKESFTKFAAIANDYVIINYDDRVANSLSDAVGEKCVTYGRSANAVFRYFDVGFCDTGVSFSLSFGKEVLGRCYMPVLGEHNVSNATAAIATAVLHGIEPTVAMSALSDFIGISRRLELLGYVEGRPVYYDYAHHPTEIFNTLITLRSKYQEVTCIFRPHTYTRTKGLWGDFVSSLSIADFSIILDIYPAREPPIEGINAENLALAIGKRSARLDFCETVNYCLHNTSGAIVLMGAGDVDDIKHEFQSLM